MSHGQPIFLYIQCTYDYTQSYTCQILNAMWKHIFLNKLLICSGIFCFIYFIIYNLSFYLIFKSFYTVPACKF